VFDVKAHGLEDAFLGGTMVLEKRASGWIVVHEHVSAPLGGAVRILLRYKAAVNSSTVIPTSRRIRRRVPNATSE